MIQKTNHPDNAFAVLVSIDFVNSPMNWDAQTVDEWRDLGFYYQRDNDLKQWWFIGSKAGLSNFLTELTNYTNTPELDIISEHIHLGPYQYLEIMTWHEPIISSHCIGGSFSDLKRLKSIIEHKLSLINVGEIFEVSNDYVIENDYLVKFFLMADSFDPSSIEFFKKQEH